ncbi:trehalose-6-phosphate synthase, partial [Bacillus sp. HC-Mk]
DNIIWIHDYHLLPFAHELRKRGVNNRIGFFLHIPFPTPEIFNALPTYDTLLEQLCDYDLLGFQTENALANLWNNPAVRQKRYFVRFSVPL